MELPHRKLVRYYRKHGFTSTLKKIGEKSRQTVFSLVFFVIDRIQSNKAHVCIVPRSSVLDQDTIAVVEELSKRKDCNFWIAVSSLQKFQSSYDDTQVAHLGELDVVKINSIEFVKRLSRSSLVLNKTYGPVTYYTLLAAVDTTFLRIFHGLTLKGNEPRNSTRYTKSIINASLEEPFRSDVMSVSSDFQLYLYSAYHDIALSKLQKYGYPRFDRAERLASGETTPSLPESSIETLEQEADDTFNVLYAPTHKPYYTTLFPFSDFDRGEFYSFLRNENIRLFIRMHPVEENLGIHTEYVDNECVFDAGHQFAGSSVDILPYMDALITDYSSIYFDYLPFDSPILFVKDDHEKFVETVGLGMDYERYFPGPKIDTYPEFVSRIRDVAEDGTEVYDLERKMVKNMFIENKKKSFTEMIIDEYI